MHLNDWLKKRGKAAKELAQELDVALWTVQRYIRGERIPSPKIMSEIVHLTNGEVQPNDFYSREFLKSKEPKREGVMCQ